MYMLKISNGLLVTLLLCLSVEALCEGRPPNVVLILVDDLGMNDLGSFGGVDIHTPNIDELAYTGVSFNRFYVGAPVCSPSRATLMTGKTPQAAGLALNATSQWGSGPGMPSDQITIAEMLKTGHYKTAHIGKWHLGYSEDTMPNEQGFDYSWGHMGGCIDNYSHFFYWDGPNRHDLWENGKEIFENGSYFPDMMTNKAEEFISLNKDDPFFLYLAYNAPHYPLQPKRKWQKYYNNLLMPRRDYAAFVSTIDENVGNVINLLDILGLRDNTIIIFLSDHGHSYEERTYGGGGDAGLFRGGKFSLFEGGIRVPAIFNWKGKFPEGTFINEACHSMDIFPTVAKLCGIETVPKNVEGIDLNPIINNINEPSERVFYWKYQKQWAVMKSNWKLIGNPIDPTLKELQLVDTLFLSNLDDDISEEKNYLNEQPNIVKELIQEYLKWEYADMNNGPN